MKVDDATAVIKGAAVKLSLETLAERRQETGVRSQKTQDDPLAQLEEHLQRIEVTIAGVPLDDNLFKELSEKARGARQMFAPTGQVDLGYKFAREGGGWRREVEVRPKQIAMAYEKFKYPVAGVRGVVKRTTTQPAHRRPRSTSLARRAGNSSRSREVSPGKVPTLASTCASPARMCRSTARCSRRFRRNTRR